MRGLFASLRRDRDVCSKGMPGVVGQGICMLIGCLPRGLRWVECKGSGKAGERRFYLYGVLVSLCGLCGILSTACSIKYSFTGASISPTTHTVSIGHFQNVAPIVNPTLASLVGEKLKERFITQTSLELVEQGGDFDFTGEITGYSVAPVTIQSNEQAAQNRLTIAIHVVFKNAQDEHGNYDQTFSQYEDFPSSQILAQVEAQLVETIADKLVEDIFNAAVANW